MNQKYSDTIMKNELDKATEEELVAVLITGDGRGPKNKQIALDILKQKWQDAVSDKYICGG